MKKRLFDFFRKSNEPRAGEEREHLQTDFVKSIDFEENPFEDETPDEVVLYDRDGNEVPL